MQAMLGPTRYAVRPHPDEVSRDEPSRDEPSRAEPHRAEVPPGPDRLPQQAEPGRPASLLQMPSDRPTISFELYPPRSEKGERTLRRSLAELSAAQPDFFSITYGAAGSTRETSRQLLRQVLTQTEITPIAHLTCVGASADELRGVIGDLLDEGVRDFLALRGDPPAGQPDWEPHPQGLERSSELVRLLRSIEAERFGRWQPDGDSVRGSNSKPGGDTIPGSNSKPDGDTRHDAAHPPAADPAQPSPLSISVATYPGYQRDDAGNPVIDPCDIAALVEKQDAGADFAITQIFYDAEHYAQLVERARAAGVHIPIVAGVIPQTDPRRLRKLEDLTGVKPPGSLLARLENASSQQEAYRIGLQASAELIKDILQAGAPGLHVYTFNAAGPALDMLHQADLRPLQPNRTTP